MKTPDVKSTYFYLFIFLHVIAVLSEVLYKHWCKTLTGLFDRENNTSAETLNYASRSKTRRRLIKRSPAVNLCCCTSCGRDFPHSAVIVYETKSKKKQHKDPNYIKIVPSSCRNKEVGVFCAAGTEKYRLGKTPCKRCK